MGLGGGSEMTNANPQTRFINVKKKKAMSTSIYGQRGQCATLFVLGKCSGLTIILTNCYNYY